MMTRLAIITVVRANGYANEIFFSIFFFQLAKQVGNSTANRRPINLASTGPLVSEMFEECGRRTPTDDGAYLYYKLTHEPG